MREPGDDEWEPDDDEELVPLGDVLDMMALGMWTPKPSEEQTVPERSPMEVARYELAAEHKAATMELIDLCEAGIDMRADHERVASLAARLRVMTEQMNLGGSSGSHQRRRR